MAAETTQEEALPEAVGGQRSLVTIVTRRGGQEGGGGLLGSLR